MITMIKPFIFESEFSILIILPLEYIENSPLQNNQPTRQTLFGTEIKQK